MNKLNQQIKKTETQPENEEELKGEKGGLAVSAAVMQPVIAEASALDKKTEMLWGTGLTMVVFGILGIDHSPVFGIFATTFIQNIFYISAGIITVAVGIQNIAITKYLGILFGLFAFLGILLPIGSFGDIYLHAFLAAVYLYIHFSKDEKIAVRLKMT